MKHKILSILRNTSPRLAARVVELRRRFPDTQVSVGSDSRVTRLEAEVESLTAEVRELREEIDESRRDARRIAELTDIVEQRLAR